MPAVEMMQETIWFDQPEFEEAECHYHLYLASKNAPSSIAAAKNPEILSLKMDLSIQRKINSILEGENKHMTEKLIDKDTLVDNFEKKLKDLEAKHAKLSGDLKTDRKASLEKDGKIKELKNTLKKLESSLATKNKTISTMIKKEEDNSSLMEQLIDKDKLVDNFEKKLKDLEAKHAKLSADLKTDRKASLEKDGKIKELKNTLQKLESSLATRNKTISTMMKKEEDNSSLMEQLIDKDKLVDTLDKKLKDLEAKHAKLSGDLKTDRKASLEKDGKIKELKNTLKKLESSLATKNKSISTMMKKEEDNLSLMIFDRKASLEKDGEITKLKNTLQKLKSSLATKNKTISTMMKKEEDNLSLMELRCSILEVIYVLELKKETVCKVAERMKSLRIDSPEKLRLVVDMMYEQAVAQPDFCSSYAKLCSELSSLRGEDDETGVLQMILRTKRRCLGKCQFIGELFKLKMIKENVVHKLIHSYLRVENETSLECLCVLLETTGKDLDHEQAKSMMDQHFDRIDEVVQQQAISSRTQIMLKNIQDLRVNNWSPVTKRTRDPDAKKNTIRETEEIHRAHYRDLTLMAQNEIRHAACSLDMQEWVVISG